MPIIACAIVVVGLATTWSISWACWFWGRPFAPMRMETINATDPIAAPLARHGQYERVIVESAVGRGWTLQRFRGVRLRFTPDSPYKKDVVTAVRAGWPLHCLVGEEQYVRGQNNAQSLVEFRPPTWLPYTSRTFAPASPLWSPLLLNAAAFASLWWIVLAAPVVAVRSLRRFQGRCTRCGYDLRGLIAQEGTIVCPECGSPGLSH